MFIGLTHPWQSDKYTVHLTFKIDLTKKVGERGRQEVERKREKQEGKRKKESQDEIAKEERKQETVRTV